MKELVFLVEERSISEVLNILLPKHLPEAVLFKVIPHDGKTDLERSIPIKLKAWDRPAKFIILRDRDSDNCQEVKNKLGRICQEAGKSDCLIRIICGELESWFLGDLKALETAYNIKHLSKKQNKSKFRDPDRLNNAKDELKRLIPRYQPVAGARLITPYLTVTENFSPSFNVFFRSLEALVKDLESESS